MERNKKKTPKTFSSAFSLPMKFVLKTFSIAVLQEETQLGFLPRDCIVMMLHYQQQRHNMRLNLGETTTNFKKGLQSVQVTDKISNSSLAFKLTQASNGSSIITSFKTHTIQKTKNTAKKGRRVK